MKPRKFVCWSIFPKNGVVDYERSMGIYPSEKEAKFTLRRAIGDPDKYEVVQVEIAELRGGE